MWRCLCRSFQSYALSESSVATISSNDIIEHFARQMEPMVPVQGSWKQCMHAQTNHYIAVKPLYNR